MEKRHIDSMYETEPTHTLTGVFRSIIFWIILCSLLVFGTLSFTDEHINQALSTDYMLKVPAQVNIGMTVIALIFAKFKHKEDGPWLFVVMLMIYVFVELLIKLCSEPTSGFQKWLIISVCCILLFGIFTPLTNSVDEKAPGEEF